MEPFESQLHTERERVKLSAHEKASLRARILAQPVHIPSPYVSALRVLRGVAFSCAAVLLVSAPLTYAAQRSGPGDLLYALEVEVIEPIEESFNQTPEARLAYHVARIEERFSELKEMERDQKKPSSADSQFLAANVNKHAEKVVEATGTVTPTEETVDDLVRTAALLDIHTEELGRLEVATSTLVSSAVKVDEELEDAAETLTEQGEEDKEKFAMTIVEKMNSIDDSLSEVTDSVAAQEIRERVTEIAASVAEGDLQTAYTLAAKAEVEVLKHTLQNDPEPDSAE